MSREKHEELRMSAHLISAREWPAYEKARYFHYLRNQEFLEYSEMIALCGGNANKMEIERQIDAFEDMNEYCRDLVDDTAFKIDRFSSFVELQKPKVKDAIYDAGFDLENFGEWVRDGKIFRDADVRLLRTILPHEQARGAFVSGGPKSIKRAVEIVKQQTKPEEPQSISSASLSQLAQALSQKIADLKYTDILAMKADSSEALPEDVHSLQEVHEQITELLAIVAE